MSDLARMVSDTAERLFREHATPAVIGAAEDGDWPEALDRALDATGFARLLVPEDQGGGGGGWIDATALLRRAGEYAVPLPLADAMLAHWLLSRAGLETDAVDVTAAVARSGSVLRATGGPSGATLTGRIADVPWAAAQTHLVVAFADKGRAAIALVPTAAARVVPGRSLAGEPRDEAVLDAAPACVAHPDGLAMDEVLALGALTRAAMIAGALQRVLALSVGYARDRVQFGRPIGAFQAIQHQLALLAEEASAASVAVEMAASAYDRTGGLAAIAAAKVRAGEAASAAARISHQIHGAIGVSRDYALQHSTRRLWAWREEYGNEDAWAQTLVRLARADLARSGAWATVVAATNA